MVAMLQPPIGWLRSNQQPSTKHTRRRLSMIIQVWLLPSQYIRIINHFRSAPLCLRIIVVCTIFGELNTLNDFSLKNSQFISIHSLRLHQPQLPRNKFAPVRDPLGLGFQTTQGRQGLQGPGRCLWPREVPWCITPLDDR